MRASSAYLLTRICKDNERKFCPSCGNPTLLRASVSTDAKGDNMTVHLKSNYQYRNRGTVYSLPLPRAGSASGGRPSGSSKNDKTGVQIPVSYTHLTLPTNREV